MQSFIALGLVTVLWALVGYTLAFGPDKAGLIGGLNFLGLSGVGAAPNAYAPTVPATVLHGLPDDVRHHHACAHRGRVRRTDAILRLPDVHRAVVDPGLRAGRPLGVGAVASSAPRGSGRWTSPVAAVVHANAGAAALRHRDLPGPAPRARLGRHVAPTNVPFVILGAGILWFGWFGFNAGSALTSGALASSAFVNTQLGAAAALLGWIVLERSRTGKVTTIGAATGAVAGLATITPAAGYVQPMAAMAIGLAAGIVCYPRRGAEGALRVRRLAGRRGGPHGRRDPRRAAHRGVREPRHQPGRRRREPGTGGEAGACWPASRWSSRSR